MTTFYGYLANQTNLKQFLRAIYDVTITNNLNEKCVRGKLIRKLAGTACSIVDKYITEFHATSPSPLR